MGCWFYPVVLGNGKRLYCRLGRPRFATGRQVDPRFGGFLNNNIAEYQVPVNGDIRPSRSICETAPDPRRRNHNALPPGTPLACSPSVSHPHRGES
jgi:hypothetical protein